MINFDELFTKRSLHIKPGLERIERSYQYLAYPAAKIPSILIGGTNGKGSTSGFLWCLLAANHKRVGLYTSPHLVSFAERFQISGHRIDEADVEAVWRTLESELPRELHDELSFFELATLIAFRLFQKEQVACQVFEVGLGGRWDATNVSDPSVSVLVSVSRDHEEYLGSDVLGILREKMGILRPGRPFLWGDAGEITACPDYREILTTELARHGCPLYSAGEHFGWEEDRLYVRLTDQPPLELNLPRELKTLAPYLKANLALAAATYEVFAQREPALALKPLCEVWESWHLEPSAAPVTLVGRCQKIVAKVDQAQRRLCLDVCHNPDGARRFVEAWQGQAYGRVPALISILRDKKANDILDILRPHLGPIVLYRTTSERTWGSDDLAERHRDLPFVESLEEAWQWLTDAVGDRNEPWVACGSVFAVGQLLRFTGVMPHDISIARVLRGDWT